jgi:hypothetical protein
MEQEEILAMQPGDELNRKIAEEVMGDKIIKDEFLGYLECLIDPIDGGFVWSPAKPYSEDVSAAELVVNKMVELGYKDAVCWADFGGGKYTEAEAICKAALLAVLEGHSLKEASDKILPQAPGDEEKGCI